MRVHDGSHPGPTVGRRDQGLGSVFGGFDYVIATLRVLEEGELRRRMADESRSSGYQD
jgi:hypothetical protein